MCKQNNAAVNISANVILLYTNTSTAKAWFISRKSFWLAVKLK